MLAFIVLFGLVSGSLSAVLCPNRVDPEQTVHLPHPTSCSKFLTCVGNHPVEQDCPAGLYWNNEKSFCDYPENSGCSRGENSQQLEKQSFNSTAVANSVCLPQSSRCPLTSSPLEQVVFLKHQDCRKFYACVHANQVELSCPPNLYWNSRGCVCDYEEEAQCGGADEVPEIDAEPSADQGEPEQSENEDVEPEVAADQEPVEEPNQAVDENSNPEQAEAREEPAEEPEQSEPNNVEAQEEGAAIVRARRAVDGEGSSTADPSGGSGGTQSTEAGSSGGGSSGGGSSGTPAESAAADVRTVSSIIMLAFTAVMSVL